MSCAEKIQRLHRQNRLKIDFERAAAYQAGVVFRIVIQIETEIARLLLFHHFTRCLPNFRLDASTTDRSHNGPVVTNEHLGRFKRRNRAACMDNGGERSTPSGSSELDDFLKDVHFSISPRKSGIEHGGHGGTEVEH